MNAQLEDMWQNRQGVHKQQQQQQQQQCTAPVRVQHATWVSSARKTAIDALQTAVALPSFMTQQF